MRPWAPNVSWQFCRARERSIGENKNKLPATTVPTKTRQPPPSPTPCEADQCLPSPPFVSSPPGERRGRRRLSAERAPSSRSPSSREGAPPTPPARGVQLTTGALLADLDSLTVSVPTWSASGCHRVPRIGWEIDPVACHSWMICCWLAWRTSHLDYEMSEWFVVGCHSRLREINLYGCFTCYYEVMIAMLVIAVVGVEPLAGVGRWVF
jgi:hypothetical protein